MRLLIGLTFTAWLVSACTLIEGDRILGASLATENAAFAGIDPKVDIGPAPVAGARRTLHYFELDRLAQEHAIALDKSGAREACFERATTRLDPETLRAALRTALGLPDLEISDLSRNALPKGRPEFLPQALNSTGLWRGRWLYGENRSIPIWVRVHSPSELAAFPVPSAKRDIGRGDSVRVEVQSGGVLLAFDAAAESSGHVGERVTVRNPANGQRFRAVVQGPGKVTIRK